MKQYSRVSYAVRCQIYAFLEIKLSIPEIASRLGFHKTTIYREIKRNSRYGTKYVVPTAQRKADENKRKCRRKKLLEGSTLQLVVQKLEADWSPQQIHSRSKLEKVNCVSHETIYKFMRMKRNRKLFRYYKRTGYSRYSRIKMRRKECLSIHQRPKAANDRLRFGDWERDSMRITKGHILVCTDRKSRYTKMEAYKAFNAQMINEKTIRLIKSLGRPIHTLTNDNGPEFRGEVNKHVPTYYCDPRKPQQRGTVENTIGILRKRLTLKTDLETLGINDLKRLEKELNLRPRKCLGYRTPYEVFFNKKVALVS